MKKDIVHQETLCSRLSLERYGLQASSRLYLRICLKDIKAHSGSDPENTQRKALFPGTQTTRKKVTIHHSGQLCLWGSNEEHWGSTGDCFGSPPVHIVQSELKGNLCHIQKYSGDAAIVVCIRKGHTGENRDLTKAPCDWGHANCLQLKQPGWGWWIFRSVNFLFSCTAFMGWTLTWCQHANILV